MSKRYNNSDPSVTEILGQVPGIGLINYWKYNTPEFIKADGKKNREIGTQLHSILADVGKGTFSGTFETEYKEEIKNLTNGVVKFRAEYPEISYSFIEEPMHNDTYGFNATPDCLGTYKGQYILPDWKSQAIMKLNKKTGQVEQKELRCYDNYKWQLSAYALTWNEKHPDKQITEAWSILFAKDIAGGLHKVVKVSIEELKEHFEIAFLPLLKLWRHQNK